MYAFHRIYCTTSGLFRTYILIILLYIMLLIGKNIDFFFKGDNFTFQFVFKIYIIKREDFSLSTSQCEGK